jgi:hypothetical protein
MGLHQIKNFCRAKEAITRVKRQHSEWEQTFASYSLDKRLIPRIYKECRILSTRRTNNPVNKWSNELNTQFSKEVQWTINMEKYSTSLAITKEMQIKTTLRCHLTLVRMAIIKKTKTINAGGMGGDHYILLVGM